MNKPELINGQLFLTDCENLTRKRVVPVAEKFKEYETYYLATGKESSTLVLKHQDAEIAIRLNVKIIKEVLYCGLIYQMGDNFYLWKYAERKEKGLGSWRDYNIFLRNSYGKKFAFIAQHWHTFEFEFMSYKKDIYENYVFDIGAGKYRILNYSGYDIKQQYFLISDGQTDTFYVLQNDGTYKRSISSLITEQKVATNAFLRRRNNEIVLTALEGMVLKELYAAPETDWNNLFDYSVDSLEIRLPNGDKMIWPVDKNGIASCNPEILISVPKPVKKPKTPWWKFCN